MLTTEGEIRYELLSSHHQPPFLTSVIGYSNPAPQPSVIVHLSQQESEPTCYFKMSDDSVICHDTVILGIKFRRLRIGYVRLIAVSEVNANLCN